MSFFLQNLMINFIVHSILIGTYLAKVFQTLWRLPIIVWGKYFSQSKYNIYIYKIIIYILPKGYNSWDFYNMEGTKMSDLVYDTEFLIIAIKISYVESQECPIHLDLGK